MGQKQTGLRVVIFHGAHGGSDTNWFPWLRDNLEREDIEVVCPRFPTPRCQSLETWLEAYDGSVSLLASAPTILVGHSLGATMALRVVERAVKPFSGVFLAAGFIGALGLPDYDLINASFFAEPFEWRGIGERKGVCRCWAGDDDPYVPLLRSQELANHLDVPFEVVRGGGHLNDETGFTTFPQLRDAILTTRASMTA